MTLNELNDFIMNSTSADWTYDDNLGLYVNTNDIDISILSDRSEQSCGDEFYEEWANNFPDPHAYRGVFLIRHNGSTISSFVGIHVDGYRCCIPLPRLSDMTIDRFQHSMGEIINNCIGASREYESYLRQAGITVR